MWLKPVDKQIHMTFSVTEVPIFKNEASILLEISL
jgi:hypothetical protein